MKRIKADTIPMRCPRLGELPAPPLDKTGWPWTAESPQLSDTMTGGAPWPRISIITPSYNQGQFIEETIRSVLLQGYPDIEYIIIDGGSVDDTICTIRKYEAWISYWISQPDRGQSDALNKGFRLATGTLMSWLNSDDVFATAALPCAATQIIRQQAAFLAGNALLINRNSDVIGEFTAKPFASIGQPFCLPAIMQPASIFQKAAFDRCGPLRTDLQFAMDIDFWIKLHLSGGKFGKTPERLAHFRVHTDSKASGGIEELMKELYRAWHPRGNGSIWSDARQAEEIANQALQQMVIHGSWKKAVVWPYFFTLLLREPRKAFEALRIGVRFRTRRRGREPGVYWLIE